MSGPASVAITGGAGFMGRHLARRLLAEGRRVTVLDLAPPPADVARGARVVRGSVTDGADVARALEGADAVVHLAARVSDFGSRTSFARLNVDATRTVLAGARRAGARRVVHMSSMAVLDYRAGWQDAGEDAHVGGHEFAYGQTKARAEAAVRAAHGASLETVIVRPGLVPYGPEDRLSSRGLLSAVERGAPVLLDGGAALLSTSFIDNLVDGLVLALDHPAAAGETFHLADDVRLTWRDLVRAAARALGVTPNLRSLPGLLVEPLAAGLEVLWTLLPLPGGPPLTRYRVRTATSDLHLSNARARERLGYRPAVSLEDGLERTVAWYRGAGAGR